MTKKRKNKGGRPEKITKMVLHKLEEAFEMDFSDREACIHAGIGTSTLYNYQKKHPEFLERKRILRRTINRMAKKVIFDALEDGNTRVSMWVLKKTLPEEFSA